MQISEIISRELEIKPWQAEAVIRLMEEGNTIPFIARYRKEAHGNLDDTVLRQLAERLQYLTKLEERKETVLRSIEEQGKLSEELKSRIEEAMTMLSVEDLYRPYKPKRRTRAMIAEERGLLPLAQLILRQEPGKKPSAEAKAYLDTEKGVNTVSDALSGAKDILAEQISDNASFRSAIRSKWMREGVIASKAKDAEAESVYERYYEYAEPLGKIPGHRILALNRGEKEAFLKIAIEGPEEAVLSGLCGKLIKKSAEPEAAELLKEAAADAWKRLIRPSVENEIRKGLTERAEEGAIHVFGENLRQLLLQPPLSGHVVLGWDPAFRTGCKLAVVDATGKVLYTNVIYPTAPQNRVDEAKKTLRSIAEKYKISLISIGNGTASRESEQVVAEFIRESGLPLSYVIVNEAGASVYSASRLAAEELPDFDVGQRSAASIARRLQDPLAELVKIEPRAIGVGQYQHDMDQNRLSEALSAVVEDCVNSVGVDINTASAALLSYVAGIGKTLAANIVAYREANGRFTDRRQLLKVPKLGPKAYEQCAGFLRVRGGSTMLDMTAVHPESYRAAEALLKELEYELSELSAGGIPEIGVRFSAVKEPKALAERLGVGLYTIKDIVKELEKPGRDPREDAPAPVLKSEVMELTDLSEGMRLKGTVRNVIDFGAFVDIGVHQDGLVHISELSDRYVKHPSEVVKVGDIVEVRVLSVDVKRKKIALSMKKA